MVAGTPLIVTHCLTGCDLLAISFTRKFYDIGLPVDDDAVTPIFLHEGQRFIGC